MLFVEVWVFLSIGCLLNLTTASKAKSWSKQIVARRLSRTHVFYPTNSEHFEYNGRWGSALTQSQCDTNFIGAGVSFTVTNCSSVLLSFANINSKPDDQKQQERSTQLEVEHFPMDAPPAGKVTVQVSRNGWPQAAPREVFGTVRVHNKLQPNTTYTFHVSKAGNIDDITPVQFRGIWIGQGGRAIPPDREDRKPKDEIREVLEETGQLRQQPFTQSRREVIEIMAPATLFDFIESTSSAKGVISNTTAAQIWLSLLSRDLPSTSISPLPYPSTICVAPTCKGSKRSIKTPTLADTYFRAGPLTSDLSKYPWYTTFDPPNPAALVLDIGATDFAHFLATSHPPNKHNLEIFVTDFTRAYVDFIKVIRRTLHDSKPLADSQPGDKAYQYISAPSSFPIFLLTPIAPQIRRQAQIGILVHKALREVAFHLRGVGDANVFVVDTANWFTKSDFAMTRHPSVTSENGPGFSLRETGHIKLAYHLSLMVCPYVKADDCPTEKYSEYVGRQYVPEEAAIEHQLHDIKIAKLKETFSILE